MTVFDAVCKGANSSLLGANLVFDFVQKYHEKIENYYGGRNAIATILTRESIYLSTDELVNKFKELIANHNFTSIQSI